jgi:hypothetical protein
VAYQSFQPRNKRHLHLVEISDAGQIDNKLERIMDNLRCYSGYLPEESDKNHKRFDLLVEYEVQTSLLSCDFYLYDFALM